MSVHWPPRSASATRTTADVQRSQLVLAPLLVPQDALGRASPPRIAVLHPPVELHRDRGLLEPRVDDGEQAAADPDLDLQLGQRQPCTHDPQPAPRLQRRLGAAVGERGRSHRPGRAGPVVDGRGGGAHLRERGPAGQQCGVHGDHGVVQRPLPGAVDERSRRRRQAQWAGAPGLARAEGCPRHHVSLPASPSVGIGQPDGCGGRPRDGQLPELGRRHVADGGARPAEGEQDGDAVDAVPLAVGPRALEVVGSDQNAPPQPHPAPGTGQVLDLGVPVPGRHGFGRSEHSAAAIGRGAQDGMHRQSVTARRASDGERPGACGRPSREPPRNRESRTARRLSRLRGGFGGRRGRNHPPPGTRTRGVPLGCAGKLSGPRASSAEALGEPDQHNPRTRKRGHSQ